MPVLRGQDLLDYLAKNEGEERDKLIVGAGYAGTRNGKQSLQRTRFFEALAEANGHKLGPAVAQRESQGKEATYRLRVGPRGLVPVGPAYTSQIGLEPGSYVRVVIDGDAIVLEHDDAPAACAA